MEPKELFTKNKIESLASEYDHFGERVHEISVDSTEQIDVFVSHSSSDNEFIRKALYHGQKTMMFL